MRYSHFLPDGHRVNVEKMFLFLALNQSINKKELKLSHRQVCTLFTTAFFLQRHFYFHLSIHDSDVSYYIKKWRKKIVWIPVVVTGPFVTNIALV